MLSDTLSLSEAKTCTFNGLTLMVVVAQKNDAAAIVAPSWLPAEVIYWTDSKTLGMYESFPHPNM